MWIHWNNTYYGGTANAQEITFGPSPYVVYFAASGPPLPAGDTAVWYEGLLGATCGKDDLRDIAFHEYRCAEGNQRPFRGDVGPRRPRIFGDI